MPKKKKARPAKRKPAAKKKSAARAKKPSRSPKPRHTVTHVLPRPVLSGFARPAAPVKAALPTKEKAGKKIGEVEDFFARIGVIALKVKGPLTVGDTIRLQGHTTRFTQKVDSMQIEHKSVQSAKKGDSIGIKVEEKCRKGDDVFRL